MMSDQTEKLTLEEVAEARARRLEAMHIQEIEGSPLDEEQVAMFEMFERERWPHERCIEYIRERARRAAVGEAAE